MATKQKAEPVPTNEPQSVPNSYAVVPSEWYEILPSLEFRTGSKTKSAIARQTGKTEGAVRKAIKAIQQAMPVDALEQNKKVTELGAFLVVKLFERPDEMAVAQWVESLKDCVGALPNPAIWTAGSTETVSRSARNKSEESAALALQNEGDLDDLLNEYISYVDAEEEEQEADFDLEYQKAYQSEQKRLKLKLQAKIKARSDFDRKYQAMGL